MKKRHNKPHFLQLGITRRVCILKFLIQSPIIFFIFSNLLVDSRDYYLVVNERKRLCGKLGFYTSFCVCGDIYSTSCEIYMKNNKATNRIKLKFVECDVVAFSEFSMCDRGNTTYTHNQIETTHQCSKQLQFICTHSPIQWTNTTLNLAQWITFPLSTDLNWIEWKHRNEPVVGSNCVYWLCACVHVFMCLCVWCMNECECRP